MITKSMAAATDVAAISADRLSHRVAEVARQVQRWGHAHDWTGTDPFEGNVKRIGHAVRRSPRRRQIVVPVLKRSPSICEEHWEFHRGSAR